MIHFEIPGHGWFLWSYSGTIDETAIFPADKCGKETSRLEIVSRKGFYSIDDLTETIILVLTQNTKGDS